MFLGDSITRFWIDNDPAFFRIGRLNRGISGDTTELMLRRFDEDVIAYRPRVVHIMGGTNDLWYGAPGAGAVATLQNLRIMAERAQAAGIVVVLAATPPISAPAAGMFAHADLFPTLWTEIHALCRELRLRHVDYRTALTDEAGEMIARYTTDGVHLTRAGYRAMRAVAEAAVAPPC